MVNPRWMAAAFVVPALVLTAACGGDEDEPADETSASESAEPTAEESAAETTTDESSAAAGGAPDVSCDATEGAVVGFSVPIPDPNFDAISAIIEARLAESGATYTRVDANFDPGKQISDIQSLVQQQVDVIIANPIDPNAALPALQAANEAGIPIISLESQLDGVEVVNNVTADVEFAASEGARILSEEVPEGGAIGALNGPPLAQVIIRENEAFAAAAAEYGLNVIDTQVNQQITPDGARQIADAWKQQNPDLAGIWTFNDTSAVGAASAVDDTFAPVIVSINGQPEAIPLVEQGVIHTTFDLQQDMIGRALAYSALGAICEVEVPAEIVVPVVEINQETVADYVPLTDRIDDPFEVAFEERDGRTFLVTE